VKAVREGFPDMIAAEMEAAAIAQVCYQYEVPFIVMRALSDIAGVESSLSFEEFIQVAAKNSTDMILKYIQYQENR
ncbi:MAG TPA: 5'-methylthioadenosine/S-adenosylhomocysteine nucleosidase, partial [Pseudogracilibacillus sp.]|nr:5'-methylthioadenosine/S-adenosylhomocysteine nucleosidase [Pseudogracilibacillus sp.]